MNAATGLESPSSTRKPLQIWERPRFEFSSGSIAAAGASFSPEERPQSERDTLHLSGAGLSRHRTVHCGHV